jgi:hypothetical protein
MTSPEGARPCPDSCAAAFNGARSEADALTGGSSAEVPWDRGWERGCFENLKAEFCGADLC